MRILERIKQKFGLQDKSSQRAAPVNVASSSEANEDARPPFSTIELPACTASAPEPGQLDSLFGSWFGSHHSSRGRSNSRVSPETPVCPSEHVRASLICLVEPSETSQSSLQGWTRNSSCGGPEVSMPSSHTMDGSHRVMLHRRQPRSKRRQLLEEVHRRRSSCCSNDPARPLADACSTAPGAATDVDGSDDDCQVFAGGDCTPSDTSKKAPCLTSSSADAMPEPLVVGLRTCSGRLCARRLSHLYSSHGRQQQPQYSDRMTPGEQQHLPGDRSSQSELWPRSERSTSSGQQLQHQQRGELSTPAVQQQQSTAASHDEDVGLASRRESGSWASSGNSLAIDFSELVIHHGNVLGVGRCCTVCLGQFGGHRVAVKVLRSMSEEDGGDSRRLDKFCQELSSLASHAHPNVVRCYGGSSVPPHLYIVKELLCTTLSARLYASPRQPLSVRDVLSIGLDIVHGLAYTHLANGNKAHGDLTPDSIMLDQKGTAKVSESGLAPLLRSSFQDIQQQGPSPLSYSAPEILGSSGGDAGVAADIFSFGVIMWELCSGTKPWQGVEEDELVARVVVDGARLPIPRDDLCCPMALQHLISECWLQDPAERPCCRDIVAVLERMLRYAAKG